MKQGLSLTALAAELERQVETRRDFVAPASVLTAVVEGSDDARTVKLTGFGEAPMALTPYAHKQVAEFTEIPSRYYDRMLASEPDLAARNINTWLAREQKSKRLVRVLDGQVRAFLSDRYRPLDNYDLAAAALPALRASGASIESSQITDTRLYIKATVMSLQAEVRGSRQLNDIVRAGIVISNSEVGAGSLRIEPLLFRLVCLNGMIREAAIKKYHVGRGYDLEGAFEVFTDKTRKLDDEAFWAKVKDVLAAAFERDLFLGEVEKLSASTADVIAGDPIKAIDATVERLALPPASKPGILRNFIEGGDLSRWGIANAITATANSEEDYETATLLERAGGKVIDLSPKDWRVVAQAA